MANPFQACYHTPERYRLRDSHAQGRSSRKTKETSIEASLDLDGSGVSDLSTGVGFFDHMLDQLARHSLIDMTVRAVGDRHVDDHHTVEDVGIALGQALAKALGDKKGLARYADCLLPMDETLTRVAVDAASSACEAASANDAVRMPSAVTKFFSARRSWVIARIFGSAKLGRGRPGTSRFPAARSQIHK